jgi:hypothetical protein
MLDEGVLAESDGLFFLTVQPVLVQDGQTPVYCKDSPTVLLADCNDVVLVMMHHMFYCWMFRLLVRSMTQLLQACASGFIGLQDCIISFACYLSASSL